MGVVVGADQGKGVEFAQGVAVGQPHVVLAGHLGFDFSSGEQRHRNFAAERLEVAAVLQGKKMGVERFAVVLGDLRLNAQYDFV